MKFVSSKELEKKIADFKHVIEEKKLDTQSEIDLLNHELECMEFGLKETLALESKTSNPKKTGRKGPLKQARFCGKTSEIVFTPNQNKSGVSVNIHVPVDIMRKIDRFVLDKGYLRRTYAVNYIIKFYVENYLCKEIPQ